MAKRALRRVSCALAAIVVVGCVVWLYLYFDSLYQRRKAERVLSALPLFPFTTADFVEVRDFALRYGGGPIGSNLEQTQDGCTPRNCDFEITMIPADTKLLRDQRQLFPILDSMDQSVGLHPWAVTVTFNVRDGHLLHTRTAVEQGRVAKSGNYTGPVEISYRVDLDRIATPFSGSDYALTRPHVTGGPEDVLQACLVPTAAGRWKRAFDIRLDCLTAVLRGCVDFRGLAPSAWADYEAMQASLR
jgi:hypothetical protein